MNLELTLTRERYLPDRTIGHLTAGGLWSCWTLEDAYREIAGIPVEMWKIKGITAIPMGRYHVVLDFSQRFQKILPHLLDVPGYSGVRIHPGNTDEDTEGCILVGQGYDDDTTNITRSRDAMKDLMGMLEDAIDEGVETWITIK